MLRKALFNDAGFMTASFCDQRIPNCVAVAIKPDGVAVRDTKDPDKTTLVFSCEEWATFIAGVKAGEFNL